MSHALPKSAGVGNSRETIVISVARYAICVSTRPGMKGDPVRYLSGQMITVGDEVVADGMPGVIVCDFDNREFAEGYGDWDLPEAEMLGGGTLSSGVMVDTVEAGLVHYPDGAGDIMSARPSGAEWPSRE